MTENKCLRHQFNDDILMKVKFGNKQMFGVLLDEHLTWKYHIKVTPTTFWPKCINLPKCAKFCSTCKLKVADKNFRLLTKTYLMHWQLRGLKASISGNIWVLYSNLKL